MVRSRHQQTSLWSLYEAVFLDGILNILGGLLLLGLALVLLWRGSLLDGGWGGFLLLLLLLGDKESEDLLGLDHVVLINVELAEDVVDLSLGHLVSPGLEGVLEHLDVDHALDVVGLEGLDDQVVRVVAVSSHLLLEHVDHVLVGAGTVDLSQQTVKLALSHKDTDVVEGSAEVIFVNGAILVDVHELEAVLVHVELLLGEASLILALSHGCCCSESYNGFEKTPHVL